MSATTRHAVFVLRGNPATGLAGVGLSLVVLLALAAPWIVPFNPLAFDVRLALQPLSAAHWAGTDQLGREILNRILTASRLAGRGYARRRCFPPLSPLPPSA